MQKVKYFMLTILLLTFNLKSVYALCEVKESNNLNRLGNKVKYSWDIIEKEEEPSDTLVPPEGIPIDELENYKVKRTYFRIYINNITEDMYLTITDNETKETKTYNYEDTVDGTISFDNPVKTNIVEYSVVIYASDKTNCVDEKIRSFNFSTPMYNKYSEYALCEGLEEYYLCQKYLSSDVKIDDFWGSVEQYRMRKEASEKPIQEENDKTGKGLIDFLNEHKVLVIITGVGVIIVSSLTIILIIKKRRSRGIW